MAISTRRWQTIETATRALYEAAAGEAPWDTALKAASRAIGGDGANIFCRALGFDPRVPTATAEIDPDNFLGEYLSHLTDTDPWASGMDRQGKRLLGTMLGEEVVPDAELVESAHYNEIYKANDVRRILALGVEARSVEGRPEVMLSTFRGVRSSSFGEQDRAAGALLLAHVDAAVNLHSAAQARSSAGLQALFGAMEAPIALIGPDCVLLHANEAFVTLLRHWRRAALTRGRLSFLGADRGIEAACRRLLARNDLATARPEVVPLAPSPDFDDRMHGLIAPFPRELGAVFRLSSQMVILKIIRPRTDLLRVVALAGQALDLSRAQQRLLGHLLSGQSIAEAAALTGISPETARSHLKAIFAKTGTHRQGELITYVMRTFDPVLRLQLWPS